MALYFALIKMAMGYLILFLCAMATSNAITSCNQDTDCPNNQYCYNTSNQCANYTICGRYNREEGESPARNPSQCGPCLPGYTAETLWNGEKKDVCSKTFVAQKEEPDSEDSNLFIWIGSAFAVIGIIGAIFFSIVKNRTGHLLPVQKRRDTDCMTWAMCNFGPSAPPLDTGVFIETGEAQHYATINNNNPEYVHKNRLVRAMPFKDPDWIKSNPNYDAQLNESSDISEHPPSPSISLTEEDTNPSSWTPEQSSGPIASRPFSQFNSEQRDNVMNAVLAQRNCPSVSPILENSDSNSESTDSHSNSDHIRGPNILISQKINVNVNVLNGDF